MQRRNFAEVIQMAGAIRKYVEECKLKGIDLSERVIWSPKKLEHDSLRSENESTVG